MRARFVLLLALAVLPSACRKPSAPAIDRLDQLSGPTMGTVYHVRVGASLDKAEAANLRSRISERLEEIESAMSTYRSDSEISRFNSSRSTDWFPVSRDLAHVVGSAQDISGLTGGAFDITAGPLVALWGFGASSRESVERDRLPTPEQIAAARAVTGFTHLESRFDPPGLRKKDLPELQVDLSAIAKGYAVDAVAEVLEFAGVDSYLVEIGGEVRVGKAKPDGSSWKVGIEAPVDGRRKVHRVVELTDTALATSGDYRSFFLAEGRRYSHLVDPRSGAALSETGLASVSVLSPTCRRADAWATALFVLGPVEGQDFAEHRNLNTLFLIRQDGEFSDSITGSFGKQTKDATQWTGD